MSSTNFHSKKKESSKRCFALWLPCFCQSSQWQNFTLRWGSTLKIHQMQQIIKGPTFMLWLLKVNIFHSSYNLLFDNEFSSFTTLTNVKESHEVKLLKKRCNFQHYKQIILIIATWFLPSKTKERKRNNTTIRQP